METLESEPGGEYLLFQLRRMRAQPTEASAGPERMKPKAPFLSTSAFSHFLIVGKLPFTPFFPSSYIGLLTAAGPFLTVCLLDSSVLTESSAVLHPPNHIQTEPFT